MPPVTVVGAGFAGCEAAWTLAQNGIPVTLWEMKPRKFSPAHHSPDFAELICSNSFKASRLESAAGLLKAEMERLGSLCVPCAKETAVAAGGAPLLGLRKPVIKAHGSSNAKAFKNAIRQAMTCHQNNMVGLIEEYMESYRAAEAAAKAEAAAGEEEAQ